jgi:hypothetical protein
MARACLLAARLVPFEWARSDDMNSRDYSERFCTYELVKRGNGKGFPAAHQPNFIHHLQGNLVSDANVNDDVLHGEFAKQDGAEPAHGCLSRLKTTYDARGFENFRVTTLPINSRNLCICSARRNRMRSSGTTFWTRVTTPQKNPTRRRLPPNTIGGFDI